ncbi:TcpQ domain-containing protein [Roseobacter sp. HKCCA0434]|uniref:TcpQ domain-containing protein n=1 Tax=Roseobacter sp. HKCCA0434 TaxID=3079297 RepID=UPI002905E427|nr:TcpQ domain-containing protein [Roseobacter sp. HKCCA0434]
MYNHNVQGLLAGATGMLCLVVTGELSAQDNGNLIVCPDPTILMPIADHHDEVSSSANVQSAQSALAIGDRVTTAQGSGAAISADVLRAVFARGGQPTTTGPAPGVPAVSITRNPAFNSQPNCPTHIARAGDTIPGISTAWYGDASQVGTIAILNELTPGQVPPAGEVLLLPCYDAVRSVSGPPGEPAPAAVPAAAPVIVAAPVAEPVEVVADPAPIIEPAPTPIPMPTWRAEAGEFFTDVLRRWGEEAGWVVLVDTTEDWIIQVPVSEVGTFQEAVGRIVRGLGGSGTGRRPLVRIFENNVIKVD